MTIFIIKLYIVHRSERKHRLNRKPFTLPWCPTAGPRRDGRAKILHISSRFWGGDHTHMWCVMTATWVRLLGLCRRIDIFFKDQEVRECAKRNMQVDTRLLSKHHF